jgi:hypothetical protein
MFIILQLQAERKLQNYYFDGVTLEVDADEPELQHLLVGLGRNESESCSKVSISSTAFPINKKATLC